MLTLSSQGDRSGPAGVRERVFVVSVEEYDSDRN